MNKYIVNLTIGSVGSEDTPVIEANDAAHAAFIAGANTAVLMLLAMDSMLEMFGAGPAEQILQKIEDSGTEVVVTELI